MEVQANVGLVLVFGIRKDSALGFRLSVAAFLHAFTQRTAVVGLRAWVKFPVLALGAPRS